MLSRHMPSAQKLALARTPFWAECGQLTARRLPLPQVLRGSGPGEVSANVGRLRDGAWELSFADEETAGYAEALMEQHEAKARAHVCEVRLHGVRSGLRARLQSLDICHCPPAGVVNALLLSPCKLLTDRCRFWRRCSAIGTTM